MNNNFGAEDADADEDDEDEDDFPSKLVHYLLRVVAEEFPKKGGRWWKNLSHSLQLVNAGESAAGQGFCREGPETEGPGRDQAGQSVS